MYAFAAFLAVIASPIPAQEAEPAAPATAPAPETVKILMKTALGEIVLSIEKERAPVTAANFLRYVNEKRLDGTSFYRAAKIGEAGEYGLVQGGLRGDPKRALKPIAHEPTTTTGLSHVSGAISMARAAPGTATADFFIVLGDLVALDAQPTAEANDGDKQGYAVFGRVIDGLEVVKKILEQPHSATEGEGAMKGQFLAAPVKILTVRRVE